MATNMLNDLLADLRRRMLTAGAGAAVAWALVGSLLLLMACMWLDLVFDMPATLRSASGLLAIIAGLALLVLVVRAALEMSQPTAVAQRIDALAGTGGQVLSGVDLALRGAGGTSTGITQGMSQIAVERATRIARLIRPGDIVPRGTLRRSLTSLIALLAAVGIAAIIAPRLVGTQWLRFVDPFGDHPPYSRITISVEPGDTKVIYGSGVDIVASPSGGAVERVELVLQGGGRDDERLPMFPQTDGKWRATVASVTTPARYFARAVGTRSKQFALGVITVPKIEDVTFKVTPPAYTNRPAYEGPLPQGGLAGLVGTKVEVRAKSNRPLLGGSMQFVDSATDTRLEAASMNPVAQGASEVLGSFVIAHPGKVSISLTDVSGQGSTDSFTAPITVLPDNRPFVRIAEPLASSFATPDVVLPVSVIAEDDWGVSRVELFRALNDSRPLGKEIAAPQPPLTKLTAATELKLSDYGLKPGDVLKLFARAEDNDPAGAKGGESSIVVIQIISKQQMQDMLLAKEGMEVLESKYEQAVRRLEALDEQIEKVAKDLEKQEDQNSDLSKELRDKLAKLAEQFDKEAKEMAKAADQDLPFDIDKQMTRHLRNLAKQVNDAGGEIAQMAGKKGLGAAGALDKLKDIQKQLGLGKQKFQEETTEPLEHLAKIYPLIEDQERFLELYQQQRDLQQRVDAVKLNVNADDPRAKARMRDLESEQRQIRQELRQLLDDIDSHVSQLPEDKKLDELRQTASEFAKAVRNCPAPESMSNAEQALNDFDGLRGATESKAAADKLEEFIAKCQGMGNQGGICLKFQPKLSAGMGNTIDQLMQAGMNGMGGGRSGYSAKRNSLQNVGLYGSLPKRSAQSGSRGGRADRGTGTRSDDAAKGDPDSSNYGQQGETRGAGEGQANVPVRYRSRTGEYFQRVADELGK